MKKSPGFWFYTGDWLKDPELRFCSIFARGLLVDLLCYMFEAKEQGYMTWADGSPRSDREIVDAISGGSTEEKLAALEELVKKGVLSRDLRGALYSRRLSKLKDLSEIRRKSGSKGGSKKVANILANQLASNKQNAKQKGGVTDTVSVTDSVTVSDTDTGTNNVNTPPSPPGGKGGKKKREFVSPPPFDELPFETTHRCEHMRVAWSEWLTYRQSIGKPVNACSARKSVNALNRMHLNEAVASINRTIANNWQGIVTCPRNEIYMYQPEEHGEIRF